MPNVPPKFQGGAKNPHVDARTTSGNGGYGSSWDGLKKRLPNYERNLVTNGKKYPAQLPVTGLKKKTDPVSTGGKKIGYI